MAFFNIAPSRHTIWDCVPCDCKRLPQHWRLWTKCVIAARHHVSTTCARLCASGNIYNMSHAPRTARICTVNATHINRVVDFCASVAHPSTVQMLCGRKVIRSAECYEPGSFEYNILSRLREFAVPKQGYCQTTIGVVARNWWASRYPASRFANDDKIFEEGFEFCVRFSCALAGIIADKQIGRRSAFLEDVAVLLLVSPICEASRDPRCRTKLK